MVINLAIDNKDKYKKRLTDYPGHWLPEPLRQRVPKPPCTEKIYCRTPSWCLLEKLDSKQRAVFILKEAFDYDHDEIASVLGITVENSRKY